MALILTFYSQHLAQSLALSNFFINVYYNYDNGIVLIEDKSKGT